MNTRPAESIPIGSISERCDFFERSTEFQSMGIVNLGRGLRQSPHANWFLPQTPTASIRNYTVRNLVLDGSTLFAYKDRRLIEETASLRPDRLLLDQEPTELGVPILLDAHVIIGCNPNWTIYNHWLVQCLPAIDWALACGGLGNIQLALPELNTWQDETLRLLGYGRVPRATISPNMVYEYAVAEYSDFLHGNMPFLISGAAQCTWQRLADAVEPYSNWNGSVYILSGHEHYGYLENDRAIGDFFQRRGYALFRPDLADVNEQIKMFRSARRVVGAHGSNMANIAFCEPGTLVWEFFPQHYLNPCNQRIAQAGGLDYWADLFDSSRGTNASTWRIDLAEIVERLREIDPPRARPKFWLTERQSSLDSKGVERAAILPLDRLLLEFESLGEDCEFGLVQRDAGIEPLGLLRFSGFFIPWEQRLAALTAAVDREFEGLGKIEAIDLNLEGEPGRPKEFMLRETGYNLLYHTFIHEGEIEAGQLRQQQSRTLEFLRRKFLEDLETGEKIWIWKGRASTKREEIEELLSALRRRGPNVLLWVSYEDSAHVAGSTEQLGTNLVRGYVTQPKSDSAVDFVASPWHIVCRAAHHMLRQRILDQSTSELTLARSEDDTMTR